MKPFAVAGLLFFMGCVANPPVARDAGTPADAGFPDAQGLVDASTPADASQSLDATLMADAAPGGGDAAGLMDAATGHDGGTADSGLLNTDGGQKLPVVFVHGLYGSAQDWTEMKAFLVARGYTATQLRAINLSSTSISLVDQAGEVADFVNQVCTETGSAKVDLIGHSLGGPTIRYYIKALGGHLKARKVISISGANHGNERACLAPWLGDSWGELCPSYAEQSESVHNVQWLLNGDPDTANVDETPFGVDDGDGGTLVWSAFAHTRDLIIEPYHSHCLDQASKGDCSAPVNTVVDWSDAQHQTIMKDARMMELVAAKLQVAP